MEPPLVKKESMPESCNSEPRRPLPNAWAYPALRPMAHDGVRQCSSARHGERVGKMETCK